MSIRLRLALWYGALFGLVLVVVLLFTYAFHARSHYDDLDRLLMASAAHAVAEATITPRVAPLEASGGLEVAVRLYGPDGRLLEESAASRTRPPVDPRAVLAAPAGPAYDSIAGLVPSLAGPPPVTGGAFGLLSTAEQRWRVFVLPLGAPSAPRGYVEVLTPLDHLDSAMRLYRFVPIGLGLVGLLAALVGGWAIAGGVLRPIASLIGTATAIADTRDHARRIAVPPHRDELRALATTFNTMLASLEAAYRAQQRFVADASHELRAPLTAIQGNLQLLRRHRALPEAERAAALAEAEREAGRLTQLVADLLALARADAGVPLRRQQVELDRVLLDAVGQARHLARGQQLEVTMLEPALVEGDPDRLRQLLLILLDNALKYTLPTGQVSLALSQRGPVAEVTIRDTGVGIAADDLSHVFERFYRADPARARDPGGTGLGLPIARWIAEQHRGSVTLASTPDVGTTATVRLPVSARGLAGQHIPTTTDHPMASPS